MNNQFDELTKSLAQSTTRRQALKKFGVAFTGIVLTCFGVAHKAGAAQRKRGYCEVNGAILPSGVYTGYCVDINGCVKAASADCPAPFTSLPARGRYTLLGACGTLYQSNRRCSI